MAGLTKAEARALVARRLGQRTDKNTEIDLDLRLAQIELEQRAETPWFLLRVRASLQASAGDYSLVPVPSGFLREWEEDRGLWRVDTDGTTLLEPNLKKVPLAELQNADAAYGVYAYAWYGANFKIGPVAPTTQDYYRLSYWNKDTPYEDLGEGAQNLWLVHAPEVLVCLGGMKTAASLRDDYALKVFSAGFEIADAALRTQTVAKLTGAL